MNHTTLPNTNLKVSKICLGTMTFGNQNTESEVYSQLDFALRFIGMWINNFGASKREKFYRIKRSLYYIFNFEVVLQVL